MEYQMNKINFSGRGDPMLKIEKCSSHAGLVGRTWSAFVRRPPPSQDDRSRPTTPDQGLLLCIIMPLAGRVDSNYDFANEQNARTKL